MHSKPKLFNIFIEAPQSQKAASWPKASPFEILNRVKCNAKFLRLWSPVQRKSTKLEAPKAYSFDRFECSRFFSMVFTLWLFFFRWYATFWISIKIIWLFGHYPQTFLLSGALVLKIYLNHLSSSYRRIIGSK